MINDKLKKLFKFVRYSALAIILFVFAIARMPFNKDSNTNSLTKDDDENDSLFYPNVYADVPASSDAADGGDGDGGDSD